MGEFGARKKTALTTLGVSAIAVATLAGASFTRARIPTNQYPPGSIVVQVSGAVKHPGTVALQKGARLQDAVDAAGGLAGDADSDRINLARSVRDGEKYAIPRFGEESESVGVPSESLTPRSSEATPLAQPSGPISINQATQAEWESLPGIGPATAQRILQLRAQRGGFRSIEELDDVKGIGPRTLDKLRPYLQL